MSGDQGPNNGHPARKVDQAELKQFLAEKQEDIPALTSRMVAREFSHVEPQTVKNNLEQLADNGEICRFSDGDVVLWWFPRENDEAGDISYDEFVDDSINYDEIVLSEVPRELAERIAEERLPFYRPRSLWSELTGMFQIGIIFSLGLIILAFGELIAGSFGLQQETAILILQSGFGLALLTTGLYVVAMLLDILSSWGYVSRDPFPTLRRFFQYP